MDSVTLRNLMKNKDTMLGVRINSDLLALFKETVESDTEYRKMSDFVETRILEYLQSKGKI